jgi:ankyrin repeat protein
MAVFYSKGAGETITLLRKKGADDNLANNHGVTPLALAKTISNFDVLKFFTP